MKAETKYPLTRETIAKAETAIDFATAVKHEVRERIIGFVVANPNCTVTAIWQGLKISQSLASNHLTVLKDAKIIKQTTNPLNQTSNLCTIDIDFLTKGMEALSFFEPSKNVKK